MYQEFSTIVLRLLTVNHDILIAELA